MGDDDVTVHADEHESDQRHRYRGPAQESLNFTGKRRYIHTGDAREDCRRGKGCHTDVTDC